MADAAGVKRFYKAATVAPAVGGSAILLDGRPVRTPARAALLLPSPALADAIAGEWNAQGDKVLPATMKLTGLANGAIDRVAPDPQAFAAGLARYGESDLICYRAEGPDGLAQRQAQSWDPLLAWARGRYDIDFQIVRGIMPAPQPPATIARLQRAVAARTPFELAALSPLVTISGSLLLALALAEGAIDLDTAWEAATVDEAWQTEHWGADSEAELALVNRRRDFEAGYLFLNLIGEGAANS